MKHCFIFLFLMAFLPTLVKGKEPDSPSASQVAETFYKALLKHDPRGLPTEEQMKVFAPLFCRKINDGIAKAREEQQKFMREHPGDKPPWVEGCLFATLFEGVTSFTLGEPSVDGDKASIPVYLRYDSGEEHARWIDVITLERTNKQWHIWDIFLNGPWEFRGGPSVRDIFPAP